MKHRVYARGLLSLIITIIMIVSMFPVNVLAQTGELATITETGTIVIGNANQKRGDTFNVDISLRDNPGVMSMRFELIYDDTVITLTNVEYNAAIADDAEKPDDYSSIKSPFTLYWENSNDLNYEEDGVFATVTFRVADDAPIGKNCEISAVYDPDEIYDVNENNVPFEVVSGKCIVVDCRPGDINGDGKANSKDVTRLRRYYAQSSGQNSVEVNLSAMDVNGDGKTNSKDVTRLRRYYAGQNVEIHCVCTMISCTHVLSGVTATTATCTKPGKREYWYCSECDKYFSDANGAKEITLADTVVDATGHTEVIDEAVPPTYDSTGLTEGSHCSVCGTVIIEQEVVEALEPEHYAVTYRNDKGAVIAEKYRSFTSQSSLTLPGEIGEDTVTVEGYDFKGWFTEENGQGTRVRVIDTGTTEPIIVYGYWEPTAYQIIYTGVPEDFENNIHTYTIESNNIYLTQNPDWKYLIFTGWEETEGKLTYTEQGIPMIKSGTTGEIFLNATWKTMENIFTVAEKQYSNAAFNEADGKYYFFYHLGNLENVVIDKGVREYHSGMNTTITTSKTISFSRELAKGYAESISNATKTSFEATLSSELTSSLATTIGASATAGAEVDGFFAKGTASATASTEVTAGASWSTEVGTSFSADDETTVTNEANSTISFMEQSSFTEEKTRELTEADPRGNYYYATAGEFEIYSVVTYDPAKNELQYDVYSKHIDTYPMTYFEPLSTDVKVKTEFDGIPYDVYEDEIKRTITESFFVFYDAGHDDVVVDEDNERTTDSFKLNASGNLPENNFYTRKGYVFAGWELRDAKGNLLADDIADGAAIFLLAQYANDFDCRVLQLTARWKVKTVMEITLNDQVATTAAAPNVVYAHVGKGMFTDYEGTTPISKITPPSKVGYTFGGYFKTVANNTFENAAGTICYVNADGTFTDAVTNGYSCFADDSVIYALWLRGIYKITLDNQNGSNTQFYSRYKTGIYSDKDCTTPITTGKIAIPEKDGYDFAGYYDSNNIEVVNKGGELDDSFLGDYTNVTADMTLTAKWDLMPFTVTWDNPSHITITVKRTSSPNSKAPIGTLSSGATVYYGDVLSVTYTADSGYSIAVQGDTSITVTGNVTSAQIYASTAVNKYTVSWSTPANATITVKRTSSPNGKASIGTLSSGAAVYYGDVLSVTYSANTGYTLGNKGSTSITVAGNITSSQIYATAKGNSYTVKFDLNSSSIKTTPTCTPTSKPVTYGAPYGDLPTPTASYYTFDGWYTAKTGGTKVTSATTVSAAGNHTLYARWVQKYNGVDYTGYTYISTASEFSNIRSNLSGKYLLVKSINIGSISPFGTFSGTLDGGGNTISGWSDIQDNVGNFGLISVNSDKGTIKNLTISGFKITTSDPDVSGTLKAGLLCAENYGTIQNVTVVDGTIVADVASISHSAESFVYAGMLCGYNKGKLTECTITGGTINSYVGCATNYHSYAYCGMVAGYSDSGTITSCKASGGTIESKAKADVSTGFLGIESGHGAPRAYSGGIVGKATNGSISSSSSTSNNIVTIVQRNCGCKTNVECRTGGIVGYYEGTSITSNTVSSGTRTATYLNGENAVSMDSVVKAGTTSGN